jgi:hypothetical protein
MKLFVVARCLAISALYALCGALAVALSFGTILQQQKKTA